MADYKDGANLNISDEPKFQTRYAVGSLAPYSGIYSCTICGHEVTSIQDNPLPPDGHQHEGQTNEWSLLVCPTPHENHMPEHELNELWANPAPTFPVPPPTLP